MYSYTVTNPYTFQCPILYTVEASLNKLQMNKLIQMCFENKWQ